MEGGLGLNCTSARRDGLSRSLATWGGLVGLLPDGCYGLQGGGGPSGGTPDVPQMFRWKRVHTGELSPLEPPSPAD